MPFRGLSIDDEGSIIFDGKRFIVNNPSKVPDNFDPGDKPVIGLSEDDPRQPNNQSKSIATPKPVQKESGSGKSKYTIAEQIRRRNRDRAKQDAAALNRGQSSQVIQVIPDIVEPGQVGSDFVPDPVAPDWHGSTPLTQGQEIHVDHLLSVETDSLAREVLIGLKREGMPSDAYIADFMSQFAEWGWDDLSSALALQVLANVRDSDWDETFAYADADYVETVTQDLGNNTREGLVIIDAGSGNVVLNKTGVQGLGGQQYVGLQDYEVEALKGLPLIFVHNHPNDTGASDDDLRSAFDAGAKLLIVITPSGREQVYVRGRDRMVKVRDEKASYEVGSPTLDETVALAIKSAEQKVAYLDDSPELVFLQEDPGLQIKVEGMVQFANSEDAVVLNEGNSGSDVFEGSQWINVLGKSRLNPFVVLIEYAGGSQSWIDLKEYDATYQIHGAENLAGIPYADESAANTMNPYIRTAMGVADLLPIAQQDITERGVIGFGATGNKAWERTGDYHSGVDIFAPAGTEVSALTDGEVIAIFVPEDVNYDDIYGPAKASYVAEKEPEGKIYDPQTVSMSARQSFADNWILEGNNRAYIIVRSGNAYIVYGHLDPDSIQVGTHVITGQTIGAVGKDERDDNDHLHLELKTHGQTAVLLDENEEYLAKSKDHRPQFFLNPLYLYTEESRNSIIAEYELDPLLDQMLAIQGGGESIDHGGHGVEFYWRNKTRTE